jgi:SAM-dependent methyltransferase
MSMKKNADAFGRELLDHLKGCASCEIVERDDGYIDGSWMTKLYFSEYPDWSPLEKRAMRCVRGRVLDIGSGAGRHLLYLQKKGFRVQATDISPLAIKVCRLRGVKEAKVVPIDRLGPRLGTFDTILMMGNNFGLFGSPATARRLLKRFHRFTSPDARIIAGCLDPYGTKNPRHLAYHRLNRRRGRVSGQLRIRVRYENLATRWFDYLFVSRKEMRGILQGTGWRIARFIEPRGANYVAVIEKD